MQKKLRYSTLQISLHWLTALLMLITILLPFSRHLFTNNIGTLFIFHKSFGLIIFFLTIVRIVVIKKQGVPELIDDSHKLQRIASKAIQGLIYLLLIIMPLSGYLMSTRPVHFLGLINIPTLPLPIEVHQDIQLVHQCSAFILIILIGLHALAALYHHYLVKDNVLKAMLFAKK